MPGHDDSFALVLREDDVDSEKIVVISADGHAGPERVADYAPYLEPGYSTEYQDYISRVERYDAQHGSGSSGGGAGSRGGEEGLWDFAQRRRHLDEDGVSAEIIFMQGAVPFGAYPAVSAREQAVDFSPTSGQLAAGCRAYNRWLADKCASHPQRHIGVARVPIPDVEASVAEVEFASKAGLRGGIALPPLTSDEIPYFNDPRYERLWAACEAHGMTLNMHGGANLGYGGGPERLALVLAETDWFSRRGVAHLIFSGVFERHPGLRLAITEQRNHWLEPVLREWDSIYAFSGNANLRRHLPRRPSEYFASNCFIGASFMSRLECDGRGQLGSTCFMWGADYPHEEGSWPHTKTSLRWTFGGDVPSGELRNMLGDNAARCYGLDLRALQPIADRIGPTEAELRVPVEQLPAHSALDPRRESWAFRREGPWH
jgi:predicted TIM-barrel fold metal-dependent hydrolase